MYMGFNRILHQEDRKRVLFRYATEHWGHHVRKSSSDIESWQTLSKLLMDNSTVSYGLFPWNSNFLQPMSKPSNSDIFQIPVHFGLIGLVQYALDNWVSVAIDYPHDQHCGYARRNKFRNALYVASTHGHEVIVKLLVERGADIESKD
jgi:hypothetical protein